MRRVKQARVTAVFAVAAGKRGSSVRSLAVCCLNLDPVPKTNKIPLASSSNSTWSKPVEEEWMDNGKGPFKTMIVRERADHGV